MVKMLNDESKGGWDSVIEFAQAREKQNKTEKRKGERELNCSINYDKAREREEERFCLEKSGRECRGVF